MAIINLNTFTGATNSCSSPSNRWILSSWSAVTWFGASVTSGFPLKYKIGANGTWLTVTLDTSMLPFIINNGANDVFVDFDVYQTFNYPSQTPNPGQFYNYGFDTRLDFKYTDYCNSSPCGISSSYSVNSYNNTITYEKNVVPAVNASQFIDVNNTYNNPPSGPTTAYLAPILKNNEIYISFYRNVYNYQVGYVQESNLIEYKIPFATNTPLFTYTFNIQNTASGNGNAIRKITFNQYFVVDFGIPGLDLSAGSNTTISNNIKNAILSQVAILTGGTNSNYYTSFLNALTVNVTNYLTNGKTVDIVFKPFLYHPNLYIDSSTNFVYSMFGAPNGGGSWGSWTGNTTVSFNYSNNDIVIPNQISSNNYCQVALNSTVTSFKLNSTTNSSRSPCGVIASNNNFIPFTNSINDYKILSNGFPSITVTGTTTSNCSAVNQVKFKPNYDVNSITSYTVKQNGNIIPNYNASNPTFINYSPSDNFEVTLVKTLPNSTSCTNTRTYSVSNPNF